MNNWAEENAAEPLKGYENSTTTSTSVSTKGEKQAGTTQLSKYVVYTRCAQSLYWLYPKVEMMKTKCPKLQIYQRL